MQLLRPGFPRGTIKIRHLDSASAGAEARLGVLRAFSAMAAPSSCAVGTLKRHNIRYTDASPWLDRSVDYQSVFERECEIPAPSGRVEPSTIYTLSETSHAALQRATDDIHTLFVDATGYAVRAARGSNPFSLPHLQHHFQVDHRAEVGHHFGLRDRLWPLIQHSWKTRRGDSFSGRIDWTLTESGPKVYEYNADSAANFVECGVVQVTFSDAGCEMDRLSWFAR